MILLVGVNVWMAKGGRKSRGSERGWLVMVCRTSCLSYRWSRGCGSVCGLGFDRRMGLFDTSNES